MGYNKGVAPGYRVSPLQGGRAALNVDLGAKRPTMTTENRRFAVRLASLPVNAAVANLTQRLGHASLGLHRRPPTSIIM